jgi:predicted glycosyltransferase
VALREKPILSLSHGSRSQIFTCKALRIPSIIFCDYEHGKALPFMHPTWEMVPEVIPAESIFHKTECVLKYPGIKEDVYAWKFRPDPKLRTDLGLTDSDLIVTVRPPASEAHYHNSEAEGLLVRCMELAVRLPQTRIVLLPRNRTQADFLRRRWPQWFEKNKTVIPSALDGLNLIWHSDLLISGGGTMNREAAALGVPAYSIFRGPIGAVDRHLQQTARLVLIESLEDVDRKIRLEKRPRQAPPTSRKTLDHIINTIEELIATLQERRAR